MANTPQIVTLPIDVDAFDEVIDVRAPVEFADDHISGAINLPVLNDEERERIGTQYKRESFEAQKGGAALVSKNIARHLEEHFADKPRDYRPLVYCFRGGQRSRSMATVLAEIGWNVSVLEGGYKVYRRYVLTMLEARSKALSFRIINGLTGSGKTVFLHTLESMGAQVLDLERYANHKGSVFGRDLAGGQPSQKRFESLIFDKLSVFDETRPIYVEAESTKIGRVDLPLPLRDRMTASPVTELVSPHESRVEFLLRDYESWLAKPELVLETIDRLKSFHSKATIAQWKAWCDGGKWSKLIGALLTEHYDQRYGTDGTGLYQMPETTLQLRDHSEKAMRECAEQLITVSRMRLR